MMNLKKKIRKKRVRMNKSSLFVIFDINNLKWDR